MNKEDTRGGQAIFERISTHCPEVEKWITDAEDVGQGIRTG
ncbi:hypothetical protein [Methanolobus zinderi]|nr:hypothetical protein [Methanolobus zinderi]